MIQRFHRFGLAASLLLAGGAMMAATPAFAAYSWNFTSCGSISGSNFGNSLSCSDTDAGTAITTTLTGWANTDNGDTSGGGGLETGRLVNYGIGIGLTNRDGETSVGGTGLDPGEGYTPEHASTTTAASIRPS